MDIYLFLGIVAGVLQLVGFILYNAQIFRGTSVPNTASWTLWTFLTIISASSYAVMTGDVAKYILPIASATATVCTFVYALFAGKFRRIDIWGWVTLLLGIISGVVWWLLQSATYANLIIILAESVAFIPLYRMLWKNPTFERPLPWYIWTSAYCIVTFIVLLKWEGRYEDLVYPGVMIFLHLGVGMMVAHHGTIQKIFAHETLPA